MVRDVHVYGAAFWREKNADSLDVVDNLKGRAGEKGDYIVQ